MVIPFFWFPFSSNINLISDGHFLFVSSFNQFLCSVAYFYVYIKFIYIEYMNDAFIHSLYTCTSISQYPVVALIELFFLNGYS